MKELSKFDHTMVKLRIFFVKSNSRSMADVVVLKRMKCYLLTKYKTVPIVLD